MQQSQLREAGLLLRPWRAADAEAVWRACQDPLIQRWTGVPRPYLRDDADGFVTTGTERAWASGSSTPLGVFDAATGELLGANGLIRLNPDEASAEIGYWTAPWARDRAVATTASRAVVRWAQQSLRVNRLTWRAEVGNQASRLVALRVGFHPEGVQRQGIRCPDATVADAWIGSLLLGELREASQPPTAADRVATLAAKTFGAPQPSLCALLADGNKITLRALTERDLPGILVSCRDSESVRWTTVPAPYQDADAEHFVNIHAPRRWLHGSGAVFAIAAEDDVFAGSIELAIAASGDEADVGFLIAPSARGRGYATAALKTLCRWGFKTLALRRIQWRAYLGNDASLQVARRAGFQLEGTSRAGCVQRGAPRDAWTAALLPADPVATERATL